ncbi:hypothetical protein LINPERPRIM_LOCUS5333 [Linum perenne]
MKAALVAQFLGTVPPIRKNITPIDLSSKNVPIWVVFKRVPAQLITQEGVGWLASHIGKPVNNFVRNGLDVKVCLLRNVDAEEITELSVTLEEDAEPVLIAIGYPQARSYNKPKIVKEWKAREFSVKGVSSSDAGDKGVESNKVIEIGEDQLGKGDCEDTEYTGSGTEELKNEISTDEGLKRGVNNNVANNDEIVVQIPKATVISSEERSVMATVISSAERSVSKNPFTVLYELEKDSSLSVEAFPPLKADVRRVSERNKKKGSPSKK